jgi:hypothetical protein
VCGPQAPGLLDFNNRRTIFTRRVQADAGAMTQYHDYHDHREQMLLRQDHAWHDFFMFWHTSLDPSALLKQPLWYSLRFVGSTVAMGSGVEREFFHLCAQQLVGNASQTAASQESAAYTQECAPPPPATTREPCSLHLPPATTREPCPLHPPQPPRVSPALFTFRPPPRVSPALFTFRPPPGPHVVERATPGTHATVRFPHPYGVDPTHPSPQAPRAGARLCHTAKQVIK